jgi:hypothetical protein
MSDLTYDKFVKRWQQVTDLPPQTVGPFTPVYKMMTKRLKIMPWPALTIISILVVVAICFILGSAIPKLVSLLQRGF